MSDLVQAAQIIADAIHNLANAIRNHGAPWATWTTPTPNPAGGTVPYVPPVTYPTGPTVPTPYVGDPPGWLDTNRFICNGGPTAGRPAFASVGIPSGPVDQADGLSHTN